MSRVTQLFGGAITTTLPPTLFDASTLRQIPDAQEVYLSKDSDLSLIVEVTELVTDQGAGHSLEKGITYHFTSLAQDNSALTSSITSLSPPSSTSTSNPLIDGPTTLIGTQTITKFNLPPSQADEVLIQLALWRIPSKKVDLVLCVNYPVRKEGGERDEVGEKEARSVFEKAVRELWVKDLGLFVGGTES